MKDSMTQLFKVSAILQSTRTFQGSILYINELTANPPTGNLSSRQYLNPIILVTALMIATAALWLEPAAAQDRNKPKVTASYIYNFARNVEWPERQNDSAFKIGLYRIDDKPLEESLSFLENNFQLAKRPIEVESLNTLKTMADYQLIFTRENNRETISDIYRIIGGKPTLLVTEGSPDKQLVMINLLRTENAHMKFEVNRSNIINQGLTPKPEIILNGGSEIDVAKLFREGQASLLVLQKQLESRESTLEKLTSSIRGQERKNTELESQLESLVKNIENTKATISVQSRQLASQRTEIEDNKNERARLEQEVEKRSTELEISQTKLLSIGQEIELREQKLATLNQKLSQQGSQIEEQQGAIVELDEVVQTQQSSLFYLRWAAILAALLVITAVVAYLTKRRDNLKLKARSQDLRMARDRLAIAKQNAEKASMAKSEFLSLMSHELRTPLQSILGYTEIILEEMRLNGETVHVNDLNRVVNNGERLLRLINDVLDLAKVESGQMTLHLSPVRISTLVEEAIGNVQPQLEKNANALELNIEEDKLPPIADAEKLLHILINLLSNATKFTENGKITVSAIQKPDQIYLSVKDTGIGMSRDQQEKIFDRFKQIDSSDTRKFQGSGLGLSIVHQFCELMGGTITVESMPQTGSNFVALIPLPIAPTDVTMVP